MRTGRQYIEGLRDGGKRISKESASRMFASMQRFASPSIMRPSISTWLRIRNTERWPCMRKMAANSAGTAGVCARHGRRSAGEGTKWSRSGQSRRG